MQPTPNDVHVNQPLTMITLAYLQSESEFVASRVFPVVPVGKQSDVYYEFDRADFNRNQMVKRAPGTESAGSGFTVSTNPYYAHVFALHKDIPAQLRANADSMLNLDAAASEWLAVQALINREVNWSDNYFTTGKWGKDITGVASAPGANQVLQWNDGASTPVENLREGCTAVKESTGFRPNTLVTGQRVWDALADHPDIVDRVKGSASPGSPAIVLRQAIASILELDRILVMGAIQNTAVEGAAAAHAFVGGKKALLAYTPPSPGLMTPAAGYTFAWTGYMGGTQPLAISRFYLDALKSDRIEIEAAYDQKLTGSALGYFFNAIVA